MKKTLILLPLLTLFVAAFAYIAPAEDNSSESKMSLVRLDDIDSIFTPGHQKKQLIANMDLPNGEGRGIRCSVSQQNVVIDTDLDGTPDTKVGSNNKIVEIELKRGEEGKKFKYWIMISFDPRYVTRQWFYETATAASCTVDGKKLLIIDDDCNANFANYGSDGVIVSPSKAGWYLSTTIDAGRGLLEIDVDPEGASLSYKPFFGETGFIDPTSKLQKVKFDPLAFVVKQSDRSFNVIRPDGKPSYVPVGTYNLERGVIDRLTEFIGSKHPPFDVLKDNTTPVEWGGPFTFLFFEKPSPNHVAAMYGLDENMHVLALEPPYAMGEKGEVYVGSQKCEPERMLESPFGGEQKQFFTPDKMSFNIEVVDVKSKKIVNKLRVYSPDYPPSSPSDYWHYYWAPFTWAYGDLRGKYILRVVSPSSRNFKDAIYEKPIDLK